MNWIVASGLMFCMSALLYVIVRKAQKVGITTFENSLGMFVVPLPFLFLYVLCTHQSLEISARHLAILFFSAVFLSWLGNYFSLRSIEESPNPGYSLIISKSYVVFTAIASVFLFGSPLNLQNSLGIFLIVCFSALIILADKRKKKEVHHIKWFWLALGAFFCWGGWALVSKFLQLEGVGVGARLFYLFFFVSIVLGLEGVYRKQIQITSRSRFKYLLGIGFFSFLFNVCMQLGFQFSPNPGFVNAANAASITLVTLLSAWLFNDDLNKAKLLGVFGVTAGLLFLFL